MLDPRIVGVSSKAVLKPRQPAIGILVLNQNYVLTTVAVHIDDYCAA